MDLDRIARTFAARRSRRDTVKVGAAGVVVSVLAGLSARNISAQEGSPVPTDMPDDTTFLFVQTAEAGSFRVNPDAGTSVDADGTPTPGGGAAYLLTLEGHTGETVYFSDRPERIFGQAPTQRFLDGLGFTPDNPPNAALVAQTDSGEDVLVVELLEPVYDETADTITYGANVLTDYAGEGLAHVTSNQQDDTLAETFSRASLFIDDCADRVVHCYTIDQPTPVGDLGTRGFCWTWSEMECTPCNGSWYGTGQECNANFPACKNNCFTDDGPN